MKQPAYDPNQHEQKTLDEGRLMRANAEVVLPLLRQQRESAVAAIIFNFKGGKLDQLPAAAASLCAVEDMLTTITNRIKKAEVIERKIHG